MNTLFLGYDVASSAAFSRIQQRYPRATYILGHGKGLPDFDFVITMASVDQVVIGLSTPVENSEAEVKVARCALRSGRRVAVYSDIFGGHQRAVNTPLAKYTEGISVFLTIDEAEAEDAKQRVFRNATCFAVGNPVWEDYVLHAGARGAARDVLGYRATDKVILSAGTKEPEVNLSIWRALKRASEIERGWKFIASMHPGDNPSNRERYEDSFRGSSMVLLPSGIKTGTVFAGVDAVVDYGSSSAVEAGFRRIPHATVFSPEADEKRQREFGGSPFVQKGVSFGVEADGSHLADLLRHIFSGKTSLSARQEAVFGEPKPQGTAVGNIARVLGL